MSSLHEKIKNNEWRNSCGLQKNRVVFIPDSCADNIFSVKQLIEKTKAFNTELHIVFIDLRKAYDSVSVNNLWKAMENHGVDNT